jgi:uncharacterized Fe-S radical SAM superfamily protein PflX
MNENIKYNILNIMKQYKPEYKAKEYQKFQTSKKSFELCKKVIILE